MDTNPAPVGADWQDPVTHRFKKGNPGRIKADRLAWNRTKALILEIFLEEEQQEGGEMMIRARACLLELRRKDVSSYIKLTLSVLPRDTLRETISAKTSTTIDVSAIVAQFGKMTPEQREQLRASVAMPDVPTLPADSAPSDVSAEDPSLQSVGRLFQASSARPVECTRLGAPDAAAGSLALSACPVLPCARPEPDRCLTGLVGRLAPPPP